VNITYYAFLRFSKEEYLKRFRNEGLLYMNTLQYFRDLESDSERGDAFEGDDWIYQPKDIEMTFDDPDAGKYKVVPGDLSGPARITLNRTLACNVYCMFAITGPVDGDLVDKRNYRLGDSFVLVLNTSEFLSRVSAAASKAGFAGRYGLVQYYDPQEYTGDIGPFRKRKEFSHQREFRLVMQPSPGIPVELSVGSLVDITSEVWPASQVNGLCDFSTQNAREAGLLA
jgi:hypothetical protein